MTGYCLLAIMRLPMILISVGALLPLSSMAAPLPKQVGSCAETFINEIQYRLKSPDANGVFMGIPSSGSAITFTNGGYQVSYDKVPAIHRSQPEDKVRVCLIFIPNCSHARRGDIRGRVYETINLRTNERWGLPDSPHMCGGA